MGSVTPGGQAEAAGVLEGSRLVGVNGEAVANGPSGPYGDFYGLLGVDHGADEAAIRKAYKRTALKTHPDRGGRKSVFDATFKAYSVLSDEQLRRDYDTGADSADFEKAMGMVRESPRPMTLQLVRQIVEEGESESEDSDL